MRGSKPRASREEHLPRPRSLAALRDEIDRIDDKLLALLNERAQVAVEVGELKAKSGGVVYRPEREKDIYRRLDKANRGPLDAESTRAIFREVIAACLSLEEPLRIACLGPLGTYSHRALRDQFGSRALPVPVDSIGAVFDEVEQRRAVYGVVPVENSIEGVVAASLDRFVDSALTIKAEILLRIDQCLMSKSGRADRVKRIVSHAQSLGQCRQWLARNLPGVPQAEVLSNARAAEIAREDPSAAAIAGRNAAERYNLKLIAANIQDHVSNYTRFFVVGRDPVAPPSGDDKTSLLVSVSHEAGALYRLLRPFADHGVSLCSIESRPLKGRPWEYLFFLDLFGHVDDANVTKALAAVQRRSLSVKVLGSYPAALAPA